jgi:hypothetical protein
MVTRERDLADRVRWAIQAADRARVELAKIDLTGADRLSLPLYSSDLAALWDRWRVSLTELQLQLSPEREE